MSIDVGERWREGGMAIKTLDYFLSVFSFSLKLGCGIIRYGR
jgi:hypothetical protein